MADGQEEAVPIVDGIRYKPTGCAREAFGYALDVVLFEDRPAHKTGQWVAERMEKFVRAMPPWVAWDTVVACERLAALVRQIHPEHTPAPAVVSAPAAVLEGEGSVS